MDNSLLAIVFEHASKYDYKNTICHLLESEDFISQLVPNLTSTEKNLKPVFMFIYLLKKLQSLDLLSKVETIPKELSEMFPVLVDLLECTFKQCNFISLKKFFTFVSELKLLDLLCLIVKNVDSSSILQRLNQYFPHWTITYKATIEKDYCIDNMKILEKVEESHARCRRLILKLAVDLSYREKYMSEQYSNDIERIVKESNEYIKESLKTLESLAGPSSLEMEIKIDKSSEMNDLSKQLLFEYIKPQISDKALVKFLEDFEPTLNNQVTSGLTSCLLPFDSMSEDEESDLSESEYELSQSGSEPMDS